jgi:hypothetical protein
LLIAVVIAGGSTAAHAGESDTYYKMHLTPAAATVRPGGATTTVITFEASRSLLGAPVDLSVTGLPDGVSASFSPRRPPVGGYSVLTLTAAASSFPGAAAITVGAIVNLFPSDPIGATATFQLTVADSTLVEPRR